MSTKRQQMSTFGQQMSTLFWSANYMMEYFICLLRLTYDLHIIRKNTNFLHFFQNDIFKGCTYKVIILFLYEHSAQHHKLSYKLY